ncbi:uncharacterized protein BDV17DRAFT_56727 [Aspergillus undulatus]|uniref:uncharacterized protein n=1 Tax=Aspergillus undulatus TaxID=1810928 RepID=UPI003CCDC6F0
MVPQVSSGLPTRCYPSLAERDDVIGLRDVLFSDNPIDKGQRLLCQPHYWSWELRSSACFGGNSAIRPRSTPMGLDLLARTIVLLPVRTGTAPYAAEYVVLLLQPPQRCQLSGLQCHTRLDGQDPYSTGVHDPRQCWCPIQQFRSSADRQEVRGLHCYASMRRGVSEASRICFRDISSHRRLLKYHVVGSDVRRSCRMSLVVTGHFHDSHSEPFERRNLKLLALRMAYAFGKGGAENNSRMTKAPKQGIILVHLSIIPQCGAGEAVLNLCSLSLDKCRLSVYP